MRVPAGPLTVARQFPLAGQPSDRVLGARPKIHNDAHSLTRSMIEKWFKHPYGMRFLHWVEPGVETPGYSQRSLRDESGVTSPAPS